MGKVFKQELNKIPNGPGVYLMYGKSAPRQVQGDKGERVLYVGKAINLRKRVSSYWKNIEKQAPKIQALIKQVTKLDFIVTDSEVEALLLENNLIKEHRPPFNVVLRDDKNYLYLKTDLSAAFPRLELVRWPGDGGAKYFGPYTDAKALRELLRAARRIFPYCDRPDSGSRCLAYHLKLCPGACVGEVTPAEYKKSIGGIIGILEGNFGVLIKKLREKMMLASGRREFEKAALARDQLKRLEKLAEEQKVVWPQRRLSLDLLGLAGKGGVVIISLLAVRFGRLIRQELFVLDNRLHRADREVLKRFLAAYYLEVLGLPKIVALPQKVDGLAALRKLVQKKRGQKLTFAVPQRGRQKRLIGLAERNAQLKLSLGGLGRRREETLEKLKQLTGRAPQRIEAYDVSHLGGKDATAAMIVFLDGERAPAHYRRFNIKEGKAGDDYAALREILGRRFNIFSQRPFDHSFTSQPDLILIDGGRGQLNVALKVVRELNLNRQIKVLALAKGAQSRPKDELYFENKTKPLHFENSDPLKLFLAEIRDEAHRFALSQQIRTRFQKRSQLESIKGVGAATRKQLVRRFGSLRGVRRASLEELVKLVGEKKARLIKDVYA